MFATFLGSDPISVGGTPEQKKKWITKIAKEGCLVAYGATEAEAGSDLVALKTRAERVSEGGKVSAYKLTGSKQWISNGAVAQVVTILARAPGGPSWFIVEKGMPGFTAGKDEDKHGIRLSNTTPLSLSEVLVPAENLVGGVEGQGLVQAQAVFGYTRLMVAALGLGAGLEALEQAIRYSQLRVVGGGPLSGKQGYTHKLIVQYYARLEACRAYIQEIAARLDGGEEGLQTEGAVAKYLATETANQAADAAIQALGGYGYTRDFPVEKIKRDAKITCIYEGTSEILEMTIYRGRWQEHMKSRGEYYLAQARDCDALHSKTPDVGAAAAAAALRALGECWRRAGSEAHPQPVPDPAAGRARGLRRDRRGLLPRRRGRGISRLRGLRPGGAPGHGPPARARGRPPGRQRGLRLVAGTGDAEVLAGEVG